MIRQTGAIFVDAYRELNARRLFWIALILSGLVVVIFALIGVSPEQRVTVLGLNTGIPLDAVGWTKEDLYKFLFVYFGFNFWLAWLVTILALVTTAGIFPDFIASGSIDLALSKPIGRWRLFLTKYATGLLFVGLQVTVFTGATFLVLGIRAGAWEPWLFLAVPLVVVFFSYLFCICTLLGLLTRSTIAALLVTLLLWFCVFIVNGADSTLLTFKEDAQLSVERLETHESRLVSRIEQLEEEGTPSTATTGQLERVREDLTSARAAASSLRWWHRAVVVTKTTLPKTGETINMLRRWLIDLADLPDDEQLAGNAQADDERPPGAPDPEAVRRASRERDSRSAWWVIGTSLGFEAVVLLIAGWLFARRDF